MSDNKNVEGVDLAADADEKEAPAPQVNLYLK
jgi:hypothetical protein